jgi:hypothetical protein
MAEEDEIIKKTRTWVKVGGIISAGLVTMLTPLIVMYVEVKPEVAEAQAGAESSIDGIIPAVVEMQSILNENSIWVEEVNEDLDEVIGWGEDMNDMDKRLIRCETYMDLLAQRRSFPRAPAPIEHDDPAMVSSIFEPEKPEPRRTQQRAQYQVPTNFKNAKAAGKARHKAKCEPSDPLCGGL